ncbi:ubiquitin carboxyl-terminal hydrolase 15 [Diutina catenulata]
MTENDRPPANDPEAMASRYLKPTPDYPVLDSAHCSWDVAWADLPEKVRGPRFRCGSTEWQVLLFPRGNGGGGAMSIYLEPEPPAGDDWAICAEFALVLENPSDPTVYMANASHHRFSPQETDWGFSSLVDARTLAAPMARYGSATVPILDGGHLRITAYVRVLDDVTGVLWHRFTDYDSKTATGYVGLTNQGATCYLNSLLQSYYNTPVFRELVYAIPAPARGSVPWALQRMFYRMSASPDPVGTEELTRSFGWDSSEAFKQHDIQELNRVLMDRLESAMKGTALDGRLSAVFCGKMRSYIRCVNVAYESARSEEFWDIQLNVQGFATLAESFQNYIEVEKLEGENKYHANEHGYQDADKGVVFESFPPVLHLQLKRFKYDFLVDDQVKIDDLFEFPDEIDLAPYLADNADGRSENWRYRLSGVLVHQGSISNGHYYALLKPTRDGAWLRFDDDKVYKVTPTQVFAENYGANEVTPQQLAKMTRAEQQEAYVRRVTSAYMLVYLRVSELDRIFPPEQPVPEAIPAAIEAEKLARAKADAARAEEAHYMAVHYVSEAQFAAHSGFDLAPDSREPAFYEQSDADPVAVRMRRDAPLAQFFEAVEASVGSPARLVPMSHRNNHTLRADVPLAPSCASQGVASVFAAQFNKRYDEMMFYAEQPRYELAHVASTATGTTAVSEFAWSRVESVLQAAEPSAHFVDTSEYASHILVFVKFFDTVSQTVRGVTHAVVDKRSSVGSLAGPLLAVLGFAPETKLAFSEELSPQKIEPLDASVSFEHAELGNGDIVTTEVAGLEPATSGFGSAKAYYLFMLTRMKLAVVPQGLDEPALDVWVSSLASYAQLAAQVAALVNANGGAVRAPEAESEGGRAPEESPEETESSPATPKATTASEAAPVDPKYLRLSVRLPNHQRYTLRSSQGLHDIYGGRPTPPTQTTTLEYEVLEMPLEEYENMRMLEVVWAPTLAHPEPVRMLVSRRATVGAVVAQQLLPRLAQLGHTLSESDTANLLVWMGHAHRFLGFLKPSDLLETVADATTVYAGVYPVEVAVLANNDLYTRFGPAAGPEKNPEVAAELELATTHAHEVNVIPVFHFHKNVAYAHGVPFVVPVYPEESLEDTRARLGRRLGLGKDAMAKVRMALVDGTNGGYLPAEAVVYDEMRRMPPDAHDTALALDHPDRTSRRQGLPGGGIIIKE